MPLDWQSRKTIRWDENSVLDIALSAEEIHEEARCPWTSRVVSRSGEMGISMRTSPTLRRRIESTRAFHTSRVVTSLRVSFHHVSCLCSRASMLTCVTCGRSQTEHCQESAGKNTCELKVGQEMSVFVWPAAGSKPESVNEHPKSKSIERMLSRYGDPN
jgi:hypothetical protein